MHEAGMSALRGEQWGRTVDDLNIQNTIDFSCASTVFLHHLSASLHCLLVSFHAEVAPDSILRLSVSSRTPMYI